MSSSLTIAVTHAISFLTRPLVPKYSHTTIDVLHAALEVQLKSLYAPTWVDQDPSHGSVSRVLSLAPGRLPPTPVWRAGMAAGVQWTDWIAALGGFEFDLFVDPGCVAFRIGEWAESLSGFHVVWQVEACGVSKRKTLAQSIVDDEEDAIFHMIDHEVSGPRWLTPILDQFPAIPLPSHTSSPIIVRPSLALPITRPGLTRSSSRASDSSAFSFSSGESDSLSSRSSLSTPSSCRSSLDLPPVGFTNPSKGHSRSRRSRGRIADVFVDETKKEVTNYDGGKTTVLTGGVMLGGPAPSAPKAKNSNNWRRSGIPGRW